MRLSARRRGMFAQRLAAGRQSPVKCAIRFFRFCHVRLPACPARLGRKRPAAIPRLRRRIFFPAFRAQRDAPCVPRHQPPGRALRRAGRRRGAVYRRDRLRHRTELPLRLAAVRAGRAGRRAPGVRQRGEIPPRRRRPAPRPGAMAGTGALERGPAGPVPCRAPGLPAPGVRGRKGRPDPAAGRCPGVPAAARRAGRRLVPRWLRPGEEPGHVVARTVRRTGATVGAAGDPGHFHQRRFRSPRAGRGRFRHATGTGLRTEARDAQRHLPGAAGERRQALVRTPRAPRRAPRGTGGRRRPGRLRQRRQPRRARLAGDPDRTPSRPRPGSLGQPPGRALPETLGPRHAAVAPGAQRLRPYPPAARTPAARPRLGRLRRTATGLRRQGSATPGATGRSLPCCTAWSASRPSASPASPCPPAACSIPKPAGSIRPRCARPWPPPPGSPC